MTRRQIVLALLGAALVLAGAAFYGGPPRFTLVNAGLKIDYSLRQAAGAMGAATGLVLLALGSSRRWLRILWTCVAGGALALTGHTLLYRLDAGEVGLSCRGLLGTTQLAWRDVRRVESGPSVVVVWGPGDDQIRIATGDFPPEMRASLDRSLARRVREGRTPPPP